MHDNPCYVYLIAKNSDVRIVTLLSVLVVLQFQLYNTQNIKFCKNTFWYTMLISVGRSNHDASLKKSDVQIADSMRENISQTRNLVFCNFKIFE